MQLPPENKPPGVLFWYRLYCGILCALSGLDILTGLALLLFRRFLPDLPSQDAPPSLATLQGMLSSYGPALAAVFVGVGVLMTALFALTFFLPRNPWAWIYHLALIGLGLTDPCLFLPCVFLMVFWLKPQTRTYFGCDQWMS
jgi:hypothetical protein